MKRFSHLLLTLLLLLEQTAGSSAEKEAPDLSIRFSPRGIIFAGRIDSEETGQELAKTARKIRPDLPIRNEGIRIDPSFAVPTLPDLKSLLAEIGLSSHDGGVTFFPDRVILTGMTDSVVTLTAIQLRLEPILGNRRLVNRICIVSSADLPDIDVRLSSGETSDSLLDFDFYPSAAGAFVTPGVGMEKLYPTLVLMSSFERFADPSSLNQTNNLRAIPMSAGETALPGDVDLEVGPPVLRAVPAGPTSTYVPLESLRFSRNSFLLQAGGREILENLAQQLSQPALAGQKVLLKSLTWNGTSPDFIHYLAEKRIGEAKKYIVDMGIPETLIETEVVSTPSTVDTGEVQVIVEIPPPPTPVEEGDSETNAPSEVASEASSEGSERPSAPASAAE